MKDYCLICQTKRGGNYCNRCGTTLTRDPNVLRCPKCDAQVYYGDHFCALCGTKL